MAKVAIISDYPYSTTGYARVAKEIAKRFAKKHKTYYLPFNYGGKNIISQDNFIIMASYFNQGTEQFSNAMLNNLRIVTPDIIVLVCDLFLLHSYRITDIDFKKEFPGCKVIVYAPLDSCTIPDYSDIIMKQVDHLFCHSDYAKKIFDIEYPDTPVTVIRHGVDTTSFKPTTDARKAFIKQKHGFNKDDTVMLFIGRNHPRKRVHILLDAAAPLLKKHDKLKLFLHCSNRQTWGNNLDLFVKQLSKRHDCDLSKKIVFSMEKDHNLGQGLAEEDIVSFYQMADFTVSATSGEGTGLLTLESFATGIPTIVPNNTTGPELINNKDGHQSRGLLVDAPLYMYIGIGTYQDVTTPELLREGIEKMFTDSIYRKASGQRGLEWIKTNANWDKEINKLIKVTIND